MKETVTARLYALTAKGIHHELTASSAADLAEQVLALTGSKQAAQLARAAYGDDEAELTVAGVRLMATGRVLRQVWKTLPTQRAARKVQVNQESGLESAPAPEASLVSEPESPTESTLTSPGTSEVDDSLKLF